MYFDEEPKTTRKDLYDFEEQYRRLLNLLEQAEISNFPFFPQLAHKLNRS
jgi:hypothetical protein